MLGGRGKLPVLAEISGSASGATQAWSLRREDLRALGKLPRSLRDQRVVLVSGEQALAAAIALAGTLGAAGRRSVLVECDLVYPQLAVELGLAETPGLHEYLRWEASAPEILQPLALAGPASAGATHPLVCVVAGRRASDPAALIGLESFRHALAKLRRAYDLVILIGPEPDFGYGSLEALAAQADTLLLGIPPGRISGRASRQLRARLRKLPVDLGGAIVVSQ
jgi:Mrp family chromosome partitioning ATPase